MTYLTPLEASKLKVTVLFRITISSIAATVVIVILLVLGLRMGQQPRTGLSSKW